MVNLPVGLLLALFDEPQHPPFSLTGLVLMGVEGEGSFLLDGVERPLLAEVEAFFPEEAAALDLCEFSVAVEDGEVGRVVGLVGQVGFHANCPTDAYNYHSGRGAKHHLYSLNSTYSSCTAGIGLLRVHLKSWRRR